MGTSTVPKRRPVVGEGIYTPPEAARILSVTAGAFNLSSQKLNRWIAGYDRLGVVHRPMGVLDWWQVGDQKGFNFHTLIEVYVAARLRELGVPATVIRVAREDLEQKFDTRYPFATRGILRHGKKILVAVGDEQLLHADKSGKLEFRKIVEAFCQKIQFDDADLAAKLWPMGPDKSVVIDPKKSLGRPIVAGAGIPTAALYTMKKAGESADLIARLFEIDIRQVADAVEFEQRMAA